MKHRCAGCEEKFDDSKMTVCDGCGYWFCSDCLSRESEIYCEKCWEEQERTHEYPNRLEGE